MKGKLNIYLIPRKEKTRLEILISKRAKRLLTILSLATGRTVTDLMLAGASTILEDYKPAIIAYLKEHPEELPPTEGNSSLEK